MRQPPHKQHLLHVDLTPFFVGVERQRDQSLRGQPLVVGGVGDRGRVAGVSEEARVAGVEVGQPMVLARRLCPTAVFRPGDLETYARVSDQVTEILTAVSPHVERPSVDEAFVDLSTAAGTMRRALAVAESLRAAIQRRLGLDCSFGLGSSRLAARVASHWARPRGLLLLLPDHEASFLGRQSLSLLDDLLPHVAAALTQAGITTLGQVRDAHPDQLRALVGHATADRLRTSLDPDLQPPIPPVTPPNLIQEEQVVRDHASDHVALERLLDGLTLRAARRLAVFQVEAGGVSIEVRRGETWLRRTERFAIAVRDAAMLQAVARRLGASLLGPASGVRALKVQLVPTASAKPQYALFPQPPVAARA
jgi:DNA polymerase-4